VTLRFTDTSLDPYARAFEKRLSPFTTAVGSGTLRIRGELANPERLIVDMLFDQLQIRTFDYPLRNAKPIRVLMSNNFAASTSCASSATARSSTSRARST
jgi:hypothetical protein